MKISDRQRRELQFYDTYADNKAHDRVSFDIIHHKYNRPWNSYWRIFELIKKNCTACDQKVLDFGCGDGYFSVILAKMGYEVFGFDISSKNIKNAKKLSEKYNLHDRTHFYVNTECEINFPDNYFSIIVGIDILHHVEIETALLKCYNMVKHGGIVIFHDPVKVPVFDRLRESKFGLWLFPRKPSIERHITEDERKLTREDLALIKSSRFSDVMEERFFLFTRLNCFMRKFTKGNTLLLLPKLDYYLFKIFPFLKKFGGISIIVLKK